MNKWLLKNYQNIEIVFGNYSVGEITTKLFHKKEMTTYLSYVKNNYKKKIIRCDHLIRYKQMRQKIIWLKNASNTLNLYMNKKYTSSFLIKVVYTNDTP